MRIAISVLLGFLLSCWTCTSGWAQATAQINGNVRDQTGAVLPGAEITATQTGTGAKRTAVSDETGSYVLSNLSIGPYRLEVGLPGFKTFVRTGIVLQVNSNPLINATLEVGQVTEQIEVQAGAALVETQTTAVGQVVDNQRVLDLPLNGRQPQELILLSGPAVFVTNQPIPAGRINPTLGLSVAGGSLFGLLYQLDGSGHMNAEAYQPLPIPFPDALQEFKLETSSTPARYGVHGAGTVSMVTRAGGNDLHGDMFEFVRNGIFNARNTFALRRDTLKRNQFGGVLGGPIVKNKLFFFAGYQGTLTRTDPQATTAVIPTPAMIAGDFTAAASPACNSGKQITLGAPFINNKLDPSLINPVSKQLLAWYPSNPPGLDQCGRVIAGYAQGTNEHQVIGRLDYNRSDAHSIFLRYYTQRYTATPPPADATRNALLEIVANPGQTNTPQVLTLGDTYLISSTIVNTFRVSAQYVPNDKVLSHEAHLEDLGVQLHSLQPFPDFQLTVAGLSAPGNNFLWKNYSTNTELSESIDMTKGSHQLAFGGSWQHAIYNYHSHRNENGVFTFGGTRTGLGVADFVAGLPSQYTQAYGTQVYLRGNFMGLFVQDNWKATRRLSLNYGIRWEPYISVPSEKHHVIVETFRPDNFANNVRSKAYVNAPPGLIFPGDDQWQNGLAIAQSNWKQFAPRIGLAFDPRGDGKEVIRAGYGVFFDVPTMEMQFDSFANPPYGGQIIVNNPPDFAHPWGNQPGGDPFPYNLTPNFPFPVGGSYRVFPLDKTANYTQQWNLSVQRQFGADWSLTLTYIGNKGTHLWLEAETNPAIYIPGASCVLNGVPYTPCSNGTNINQRRLLSLQNPANGQYYSNVIRAQRAGNANYEGALLTLQKRFTQGVSALANYTWSHCIDVSVQPFTIASATVPDISNLGQNRANCNQDIRQNFSGSFVLATPKFSSSMLQKFAGSWQVSPIIRINSALPINPAAGKDNAFNGDSGNQRPNLIGDWHVNQQSLAHWFSTAAFVANGPGQLGSAGRNILRGAKTTTINVALSRKFAINDRQNVELRAEAFNLPNLVNPMADANTGTISSPLFGKITAAGDPRILQFALKYVF
jgi:hypothetical protein